MSAISPPSPCAFSDQNPHRLTFGAARFPSHLSRIPGAALCRCLGHSDSPSPSSSSGGDSSGRGWDSALREAFKNAVNRLDLYVNSHRNPVKDARRDLLGREREVVEDEDWDWDQWKKHFEEVEAQERIVSILKSQLGYAVLREDYEDAARIKVAIAAAATNDIVGRVMFNLNSAIEEERYKDAILIRDCAGAGLVGWWAGISHDTSDPYGRIIRISAEHGRYVARSYSPRQLVTATAGVPLFEIFLRVNRKGEYKQQAVYLKRQVVSQDSTTISSMSKGVSSSINQLDSSDPDKNDALPTTLEDGVDINDDSDVVSGLSGLQNIVQDIIPGVKVKVVKVTVPGKVDRDLISKVIEQIIEEEDDVKDTEQENIGTDDDTSSGNDEEQNEIETEASAGVTNNEERSELPVKVIVGGLIHKFSRRANKDLQRVPAELVKKGRLSFSFSIEKDDNKWNSHGKGQSSSSRKAKLPGQRSIMFDLSKFIGRKKIPLQVLKDVGELINLTLSQAQNHQPLSALTTFSRIETLESSDPLNGLYIGGHGLYTSEVIHLKRRYGQWQEDGQNKEHSDIEFYEYVEALKITGDPYVPAGQVAFRAKVGKRNQLPHRGIIPEEFGVIARYRGQGRLAEPGFQNPRWVDGELVILDGKYIKGGPVVGFVYWSPDYHFLVFFNRLRLQE